MREVFRFEDGEAVDVDLGTWSFRGNRLRGSGGTEGLVQAVTRQQSAGGICECLDGDWQEERRMIWPPSLAGVCTRRPYGE